MFRDVFCELLKKNSTNPLRIAKDIGVPKSVVYEWKDGKREPSAQNMVKLSDYFGVSLDYLTGKTPNEDSKENELIVMLRCAREISEDDHDTLIEGFKKNLNDYLSSKAKENDKKRN